MPIWHPHFHRGNLSNQEILLEMIHSHDALHEIEVKAKEEAAQASERDTERGKNTAFPLGAHTPALEVNTNKSLVMR